MEKAIQTRKEEKQEKTKRDLIEPKAPVEPNDLIEPKDPENQNQSLPKTGGFNETNGSLTSLGMILISLGGALIFFNKRKKKNSKNHI